MKFSSAPTMAGFTVSVAVIDWMPEVLNETFNV